VNIRCCNREYFNRAREAVMAKITENEVAVAAPGPCPPRIAMTSLASS
jgi:hypothetical protein